MLTKKLGSLFCAAVLAQGLALAADAAPTRYYVPKSATAKKTVQNYPTKRSTSSPPTKRSTSSPLISISPAYYAGSKVSTSSGGGTVRKAPASASSKRGSSGSVARGGGDYLHQVGGGSARWPEGKTIQVYVPGGATYKNMVANAFNKWSSASGGKINWTMTNSPSGADYTFSWTNSQREVAAGTEAGLTTTDTVSNGYGETIERAHTSVLTRYNGRPLSNAAIAETVLHEIGHGLGLEGHSSNPRDIMYYAATSGQGGLTARDMNTISKLYR